MWAYLGIVIAALLFSLWAKDKELKLWKVKLTLPSWTIGIVGFSYIAAVVTAVIAIAIQAGSDWNAPLQGTINITFGEGSTDVITGLRLGYWLAWGAGLSLIVLALLRNKITGKSHT